MTSLPEETPYIPNDVTVSTREDAEKVIAAMKEIVSKYGVACAEDLNDLVGVPSVYLDHMWGWKSLDGAKIHETKEGYLICLPPAEPI